MYCLLSAKLRMAKIEKESKQFKTLVNLLKFWTKIKFEEITNEEK